MSSWLTTAHVILVARIHGEASRSGPCGSAEIARALSTHKARRRLPLLSGVCGKSREVLPGVHSACFRA